MLKWFAGLATIALLACGWWAIQTIGREVREINEPDPAKIDSNKLKRLLNSAGIESDVLKVLYVNQDSMAYIFEGSVSNLKKSEWNLFNDVWIRQPQGIILTKSNANSSTIGFSNYSTVANLEPFFGQHWKDLVK